MTWLLTGLAAHMPDFLQQLLASFPASSVSAVSLHCQLVPVKANSDSFSLLLHVGELQAGSPGSPSVLHRFTAIHFAAEKRIWER